MSDILTKALEEQNYLMHHGILGQKWGVRRYQNPDGSMTREQFIKSIKPEFIDVYGSGNFSDIATISFSANGIGGHSLDIEWDIKNNRPVRNDVSVNG